MKQFLLSSALLLMTCGMAMAQDAPVQPPAPDLMPPVQTPAPTGTEDSETHPALRLTPDKSELVHLDREAASIIVGNPAYATVLLDSPRLAVVIPRTAGATYFTALDKDGNVIMQRHVIVAAPKKNYVRVRRSCANAAEGKECAPTSVYFCPDMCHEVGTAVEGDAGTPVPATTSE